ncbi:MAG: peptidoglycan-binding protein, partial [Acidobacterium ailaaui]|nr:peptidoglycan-binding protein [Pseudacidobacterium ailaaui]
MANAVVEWFNELPTAGKVAVGLGGAAVVLLIWRPWQNNNSSSQEIYPYVDTGTLAPGSGGGGSGYAYSPSGGSSGNQGNGGSSGASSGGASSGASGGKTSTTIPKTPVTSTGGTSTAKTSTAKTSTTKTSTTKTSTTNSVGYVMSSLGVSVSQVQSMLKSLGYNVGPIDNIYGPQTSAAVRQFQAAHGLTVDAIVGPKTLAALKSAVSAKTSTSKTSTKTSTANSVGYITSGLGVSVSQVQSMLKSLGYNVGPIDNIYGPQTSA